MIRASLSSVVASHFIQELSISSASFVRLTISQALYGAQKYLLVLTIASINVALLAPVSCLD